MVRRARVEDVDVLLRIQREACVAALAHVFPQDLYPFPDDEVREAWAQAVSDPDVEAYVTEQRGEAVASVSIRGGFLRTLYVVPSHWGRGLGSELHDLALDRLRARGETQAKLWTLEENHAGRRFYERRGWTLAPETRVVPFPPHPLDVSYSRDL